MKKTKYITDAAMITAVMAVLLLLNNMTSGLLVVNLSFLLPVPISIYGLKHDYKKAILPAVSTIVISLIINWLIGLLYVLPSAIISIIYVVVMNKFTGKTGIKLSIMFIGSLIVNVLTTVIFSKALFGYTIIEDTLLVANGTIDLLAQFGLSNDLINNTLATILVSVIPAIIAINSLMESIITYLIISILAQRILKIDLGGNILTINIKVPAIITYICLPLSLVSVFFIGDLIGYETFGVTQVIITIGLNMLVLLSLAYLIEAIVVLSLYFTRMQKRYLMIVSLLILFIMPLLLVIIGFVDSIFNLKNKILLK